MKRHHTSLGNVREASHLPDDNLQRKLAGDTRRATSMPNPHDQQDLVARVFRSKIETMKMMLAILKADIYVVEFQERGLSHAHFMLM